MSSSDAQQVAYTITLFRDAAHEWYMGYEGRKGCTPRDWAPLGTALLDQFASNIRSQEAQPQLMSISEVQRLGREYASQFGTLLDPKIYMMKGLCSINWLGFRSLKIALSTVLNYAKTIAQVV